MQNLFVKNILYFTYYKLQTLKKNILKCLKTQNRLNLKAKERLNIIVKKSE